MASPKQCAEMKWRLELSKLNSINDMIIVLQGEAEAARVNLRFAADEYRKHGGFVTAPNEFDSVVET